MNREIKFKAYIKKSKEVVEVKSLHLNTRKAIIGYSKSKTNYGNYSISFDDIELMQFTGLYNKNKVPIYEGDIVSFKIKGEPKVTQKIVIEFNEEHGAYLFGIYKGSKMPCGKTTRMNKYTRKSVYDVEVLGNKFDNPDLLGE